MASFLPTHSGLLPKWLFLVSVVAFANSVQAYTSLYYTQRVYVGPKELPPSQKPKSSSTSAAPPSGNPDAPNSPVTGLSARTFGTWTFLSSVVRLYAAYYIDNPVVYQLAIWSYFLAFAHFMSEWLVFGTTRWGKGLAGPAFVSTGSLIWMFSQWGYYVK